MPEEKNKKPEEIEKIEGVEGTEETEENVDNRIAPDIRKRKRNHWGHGSQEKRKPIKSYKSPGRK